jgi:hypothetical protein
MPTITTQAAVGTYQNLIDDYGEASCGTVAIVLNALGFTSLRGKKVSRMAVWREMQRTQQGRDLLQKTRIRIWDTKKN